MVCSRNVLTGECVGFSEELGDDFKFDFVGVYEYHLLKCVAGINFVDELSQCPEVGHGNISLKFNSTKFYNLLQLLTLDHVIHKLMVNLAFFTELIYFPVFR